MWQAYGEKDPYFGVLTHPAFKDDRIADNREVFFASGEERVARELDRIETAIGPMRRGHALDFGAGVGRLSLALAERFTTVTSVDVAPGMRRELERNAGLRNLTNLTTCATLAEAEPGLDLAFSLLVLQHLPVVRGIDMIGQMWELLAPGGVLAVEVPVATSESLRRQAFRHVRDRLPLGARRSLNVLRGRAGEPGAMQMNVYSINRLLVLLTGCGATQLTLLASPGHDEFTLALLVARKPSPAGTVGDPVVVDP